MATTAKSRITYFDVAKAVAILAVIWGHFLYPTMLREVYIFHVPLFFMISGFFISKRKDTLTFTKDKVKQLLLPYLLTGIGMLLVLLIKLLVEHTGYDEARTEFINRLLALLYGSGSPVETEWFSLLAAGPIWFLLSLFVGIVIVRICINVKWGFIPIIVLIAIGYITSRFLWIPLSIQAGMVDAGYIYLGYLLKCASTAVKNKLDNDIPTKIKVIEYIIEIAVMIGCFVAVYFYLITYPFDLILLSCNKFPYGWIDVLITLAGSFGVLLFCKLILDNIPGIKHALIYIGRNTLLILCFHSIDTIVIDWSFLINMFPGEQGKAIVITYIAKVAIYVVLMTLWNLVAGLIKKSLANASDDQDA